MLQHQTQPSESGESDARQSELSHALQVLTGGMTRRKDILNAFDQEKEAVMSSLFKLMLVNTGPRKRQHSESDAGNSQQNLYGSGHEEVLAARNMSFQPLCAMQEALKLCAENQPLALRTTHTGGHTMIVSALRVTKKALEYIPCQITKRLMALLRPKLQLVLMASIPGFDRVLLSMKLLAEGPGWCPGGMRAVRRLHVSEIDMMFCQQLQGASV